MNQKSVAPSATSLTDIDGRQVSRLRQPSIEERRKLVAESLNVGNPPNNAKGLLDVADPKFDCQLELLVDAIKLYERNPRRTRNAKFDEIKQSIRVGGIRNPLTVTRRPGESDFIVEAGGNTRLVAIQQLWAETGEPRFQRITVMFRPWRSESHVLTSHMIENDQRGELTFWDRANGMMALKAELESEKGCLFSLRELEEELQQLGMTANRSSLSHCQFAIEKLSPLGAAVPSLTGLDVKIIQPRLNLLKRYAEKRAGTSESELYARVFNSVFEHYGERYAETHAFNAAALCQDCEQALAASFGEAVPRLRTMLDALEKSLELSLADLEMKVAPGVTIARASEAAVIVSDGAISAPSVSSADSWSAARQSAEGASTSQAVTAGGRVNAGADSSCSIPEAVQPQPPQTDVPVALLEDVKQCVSHFARITRVGDCFNFHELMPCGYYMEVPSAPLDLEFDKPLRHRAWWLLALISGQMHEHVSRRLPVQSPWRRIHTHEGMDESALPLLIENELAGPVSLDVMLTDWLLDPAEEAAALFWEILVLVREIRRAAPPCFAMPDRANESKKVE